MTTVSADIMTNVKNFGIEIETVNMNKHIFITQMAQRGLTVITQGYNHNTSSSWKIVPDGSIKGTDGAEIVSPILNGEEGLNQIKTVCECLEIAGAKVNKSCGVHVHHEVVSLNETQMKNLLTFYAKNEKTIDSFMPISRRGSNNTYCQTTASALENLERGTQITSLTRYNKLNLQSYYRQGTIEYRQHAGTTDSNKIIAWVILTALINKVGPTIKSKTTEPMRKIYFKRYLGIVRTELWDFFNARAKALA